VLGTFGGDVVGADLVVSGDRAGDRDGLGDSDAGSDAGSVSSGTTAERVGLGKVRVGDSDPVTEGRSAVDCPSLAPQADKGHSARTHRRAQRAAHEGIRILPPQDQVPTTMPPRSRSVLIRWE